MKYPCPCCGYAMFSGPPGTEDACEICGWRDDAMQLRFPLFAGRPNGMSLIDAQLNYSLLGAVSAAAAKTVHAVSSHDVRDPEWRPLDRDVDDLQDVPVDFDGLVFADDPAALYYWLPRAEKD